ncbi:unnamed protein product [Trichobilharzia szidati]|nr:unnamed protein product [Trichobilharzia szidati]
MMVNLSASTSINISSSFEGSNLSAQQENKTGVLSKDEHTAENLLWGTMVTNIITSFLALITAGIFIGNLLVILAVATTSKLRRITDQYLLSLAIADFLVSVFVLPFAVVRHHLGYWPFESAILCYFYISIDTQCCMASIFNLCCISLDRYVAISHPIKYITKRNRSTALAMIVIAWILPLPAIVPPLIGSYEHTSGIGNCYLSYDKKYRIYSSVLGFFVPLSLLAFVNVRIFCIINNRMKAFENVKIHKLKHKISKSDNAYVSTSSICTPSYRTELKTKWNKWRDSQKGFSNKTMGSSLFSLTSGWAGKLPQSLPGSIKKLRSPIDKQQPVKSHISSEASSACVGGGGGPMHSEDNLKESRTCSNQSSIHKIQTSKAANSDIIISPNPSSDNIVYTSQNDYISQTSTDDGNDDDANAPEIPQSTNKVEFSTVKLHKLHQNSVIPADQVKKLSSISYSKESGKNNPRHINTVVVKKHSPKSFQRHERALLKKEKKTSRTVAAIVGCYTLCWLPFFTFFLGEAIFDCTFSEGLYSFVCWLGYSNSICNPLIYTFFNKEYACAFKRLLCIDKCSRLIRDGSF